VHNCLSVVGYYRYTTAFSMETEHASTIPYASLPFTSLRPHQLRQYGWLILTGWNSILTKCGV